MTTTPLQDIQQLQTDSNIFDAFLHADANTQVDFSAAQDGSDMQPSLAMLMANMGLRPASGGPVAAIQTAGLPAHIYDNGASGVGATLTATANGAFPAADIDNVAPVANMRVWIINNTTRATAGIYVFTQVGDAGTPWILTRATDANSAAELGYLLGYVSGGATLSGTAQLIPISGAALIVGTTLLPTVQLPESAAVAAETARAEAAEAALGAGASSCAIIQTANFAPDGTAYLWPIDASGGNIVVSVPAGAGFANQRWKFKRVDNSGHTVTITMAGGETLDGASTQPLAGQWSKMEIHNKRGGTTWYITGN